MIKSLYTIFFLIFLLISCKTDKPATQEISKEEATRKTAETEITTVSTVSADKKLFLWHFPCGCGKRNSQYYLDLF